MSPSTPEPDLDRPIWGNVEIAKFLNMSTKRCEHLLGARKIDADKFGGRWVSTPRRLMAQFAGSKGGAA
jgi:hypothetical protein